MIQDDLNNAVEETALLIDAAGGVLMNDTSANGPLTVVEGWQRTAAGGQIYFFSDGSYDYVSAAGFSGTDSVQYTALDNSSNVEGTGTLTIDVAATAHLPFVTVGSQLSARHVVASGFDQVGNGIHTGAFAPVILSGGGYVVAVDYLDQAAGQIDRVQTYDASNNLVATFDPGSFIRILKTAALSNGNYALGWDTRDQSTGERTTHIQLFDAAGTSLAGPVTIDVPLTGDTLSSVTALPGGGFVALQFGDAASAQLYARSFSAAGVPESQPFPIASIPASRPSIAVLPDGEIVFAQIENNNEVHVQRYDAHGNPIGSEILPPSDGNFIDPGSLGVTVMPTGGFAVSWMSRTAPQSAGHVPLRSHVQLVDANGTLVGNQATRDVDYTTLFGVAHPTVTPLTNGGFVIDWRGIHDPGIVHEFQAYDPSGNPAGPISGFTSLTAFGVTRVLVFALPAGGFAVGNQSANPPDHDLRIYDNNGNHVGDVRMQDTGDGADFSDMLLANLPNGNTLILYHDEFRTLDSSRDAVQTIAFGTVTPAIQTGITFGENSIGKIPVAVSIPDPDGSEIVQWLEIAGVPAGWTVSDPGATVTFDGAAWKISGGNVTHGGDFEFSLAPAPYATGSAALTVTAHTLDTVNGSQNQSFPAPFSVNVVEANPLFDFSGDGRGDILWQNADGTPAVWLMNGTGVASQGPGLPNSPFWKVIDAGDFDRDGKADILWQNDNGTPAVWLMNGTGVAQMGPPLTNPGPAWHAKEAADFNGDAKADIVWQNNDGTPAVWLMDGVNVLSTGPALANPGAAWHVKDAADFNGDHKADILWQNDNSTPAVWLMDGVNLLSTGPALSNPGPSWHAVAAADFNGDHKADILWQNDNGTPAVWLMDGTAVLSTGPALANPGATWHVEEAADANGDGKADITWQNDNGTPAVWLMDGTAVLSMGPALTNPGAGWHII